MHLCFCHAIVNLANQQFTEHSPTCDIQQKAGSGGRKLYSFDIKTRAVEVYQVWRGPLLYSVSLNAETFQKAIFERYQSDKEGRLALTEREC
jgi:hypothetical protein